MSASKYQPRDDCPKRLGAPPCPLYGAPLPDLEWGPPSRAYSGAEILPIRPGHDVSKHKFGICAVCSALLMFDRDDVPLHARPSLVSPEAIADRAVEIIAEAETDRDEL